MVAWLIFALRPGSGRAALAGPCWVRFTEALFFGSILVLVLYLLYGHWKLGTTRGEVLAFRISAGVRLVLVQYRISPAIDRVPDEARRARNRSAGGLRR